MSEREKTIAEIQFVIDNYPENDLKPKFSEQELKAYELIYSNKLLDWLRFLLSELERAEEQNRKLREERDELSFREREAYGAFKYWFGAWQEVKKDNGQLQDQLQSAQAEVEKWKQKHEECAKISMMLADRNVEQGDEIERLREEREKLIEGLRTGLMHAGSWSADDYVSLMRDTLKECGVMVE